MEIRPDQDWGWEEGWEEAWEEEQVRQQPKLKDMDPAKDLDWGGNIILAGVSANNH